MQSLSSENTQKFGDDLVAAISRNDGDIFEYFMTLDLSTKIMHIREIIDSSSVFDAIVCHLLKPTSGSRDDRVCQWLYDLYCTSSGGNHDTLSAVAVSNADSLTSTNRDVSRPPEWLHVFTLQFVPILVWSLLHRQSLLSESSGITAVLLIIFNKELEFLKQPRSLNSIHTPLTIQYDVPEYDVDSVYNHHSNGHENRSNLTSSMLKRHTERSSSGSGGNTPEALKAVVSITHHTALRLVDVCLRKYVSLISMMSADSHQLFCVVAAKLTHAQGAHPDEHKSWQWGDEVSHRPMKVTTPILEQLVIGVAYCLSCPWTKHLANVALRVVHSKATLYLQPEILLQTTCLLERFDTNPQDPVEIPDTPNHIHT